MNSNSQLSSNMDVNTKTQQVKINYVGPDLDTELMAVLANDFDLWHYDTLATYETHFQKLQFMDFPDVLLIETDEMGNCFTFIEKLKSQPYHQNLITILISPEDRADWKARADSLKVQDFFIRPFTAQKLQSRIRFLIKMRMVMPLNAAVIPRFKKEDDEYHMPVGKRIFDIVLSALALLILSPLLILIAILIRLESAGSVIYKSDRVGTGYKVFKFYKFRSMHVDADKHIATLLANNQYNDDAAASKSVYFKVANDPRVTKLGRILRNTSLDELPQLFNILIGDMSFVGNRPLPLYEAEQLTSNQWSMRFLGPAGLTGLWQVSKRGKKDMSEQERKELDNEYAREYSLWLDLKIILYTIPALIQQEKV
jgi:lipopolysaccharide/colanic/teichoic acid biosynthesis glycosyltransferase